MTADDATGAAGRILFLVVELALLALNALGLPANWIVLALAALYAVLTGMERFGWGTLLILTGIAAFGELLELLVGVGYTAKRGGTRRAALGAFVGGLAGAVLATPTVPPLGSLFGAFAGAFLGAALFEYLRERRTDAAWRAGRAAFIGKIFASAVKTFCGFSMWCVLAFQLLRSR